MLPNSPANADAEPIRFDANVVAPPRRSDFWRGVVASTYFPLDIQFRRPAAFNGRLSLWDLGELSLSRNTSDGLIYRRRPRHFINAVGEDFLVTLPIVSDVAFSQCGVDVRCSPGKFILERSHEPYEFSHDQANDLWVLKIPARILRERVRLADRFCALQFDATGGVGALLLDMLRLIPGRYAELSQPARLMLGRQLTDLLVLALAGDDRTLTAGISSVRDAHLARIESYARRHLFDPALDPERIAGACGISLRYLHLLFRDTGQTLGHWLREQRLLAARDALGEVGSKLTVAEIALRCGFGDQAQFSRLFKSRFAATPREFRERGRQSSRTTS